MDAHGTSMPQYQGADMDLESQWRFNVRTLASSLWDFGLNDGKVLGMSSSYIQVLKDPGREVVSSAKWVLINCQVVKDLRTSVGFFTE